MTAFDATHGKLTPAERGAACRRHYVALTVAWAAESARPDTAGWSLRDWNNWFRGWQRAGVDAVMGRVA